MTSEQIFIGLALIVGIAAACQLIAPKIKLPALVLLLPAGFLAGVAFDAVNPEEIFGDAFTPMVNFAVALILFHGGFELFESPIKRGDRPLVLRLVWIGGLITWICASLAAYFLLQLSVQLAVLLGAIVIVSGPTVVSPILQFVRPDARLRRILAWEGTLIDPVGAVTAVIIFQGVQASQGASLSEAIASFLQSMAVGLVAGFVGLFLIWGGLLLANTSKVLGAQALLGAVLFSAGIADALADDAGLVTALTMGMGVGIVAPKATRSQLAVVKPFFDTIVNISIGVLFVSISALVTPQSLQGVALPALILVTLLVLVVRPAIALITTWGTSLTSKERLFIGWMAPRGIVAASTAASFGATLISLQVPGGEKLLPATFTVIAGTVAVYSFTAVPVARLLGVRGEPSPDDLVTVDDPLALDDN